MNLPETRRSRFGGELNAEKMKKAVWLRPEAVAQIEFLEWTEADRLRHSKNLPDCGRIRTREALSRSKPATL
jgi:ATP-dependent DNA ligase